MSKMLFFVSLVAVIFVLPRPVSAQAPSSSEELSAAFSRVGEFMDMAAEFDAPLYFPSDWATAEAAYTEASLMTEVAGFNEDEAIAALNLAADSFESVLKLSLSLYAQAREDEIMVIRDNLTQNGARAFFPELVGKADLAALEAWDLYEAGNYRQARDRSEQALTMFQVLETGFDAWQMRREISLTGFVESDDANIERADETLGDAVRAYNVGDFSLAMKNAVEARSMYGLLASSGWASLAERRASTAEAERTAAIEMRANIAGRDIFEQADLIYMAARNLLQNEQYMEASVQFDKATGLYTNAISSTLLLRAIAANAIMEANLRIEGKTAAAQTENGMPTLRQHLESIRQLQDMIKAAQNAKTNDN